MKFPLLASLAGLSLATTGLAHADADLDKARVLFPAFSQAVYTDETKAEEIYKSLAGLSPAVQERLLAWLDKEFAAKKAAYHKAKTGHSSSSLASGGLGDAGKIKALQKQLSDIRNTSNESEMKKTLKATGWPALKQLLRMKGSTIQSMGETSISDPDPDKIKAVLAQAKQVGKFRYELRMKLKQAVMEVDSDIEKSEAGDANQEEVASIKMNRQAASVLQKNEKLKGEIPSKEYKGILEFNHWRIAAGLQPLLIDPKLCAAARDHCKDMEKLKFFAHQSPVKGKKEPWDRAKNFGTTARGENIAINDSTEASNMAWFYSPGHHKNMFKPDFSVIGLGIQGRHYCQLFR